jgi:probable phosphoglycerate mutase
MPTGDESMPESQMLLIRHGPTEWSRTGRHTGLTDVPLAEEGRDHAVAVGRAIVGLDLPIVAVLSSPLVRAWETCGLAGFGDEAVVTDDLREWDYGAYDGLTTPEIRRTRPGWTLWRDGVPGGETLEEVGRRADRVIASARARVGTTLCFAHGHILRVLGARWVGLGPEWGQMLGLSPAQLCQLGWEREQPVIWSWNERRR